ncbi:probable imidazolonepropionase isoform X2 [Anabrus simplex]|uniref:probable imidazolonepropionase isoform X2 n=1 Tax=Anabrus simplex TaxID=316456 RepID=UPI0035A350AD
MEDEENRFPSMGIWHPSEGRIAAIGSNPDIRSKWSDSMFEKVVDASGMCILPGFIDTHTHPVWSGDRVNEFVMKVAGASYLEIHQSGGGIYSTVNSTIDSSEETLYESLKDRLMKMLHAGTTVVECKSGYGLETEAEFKLLRVLQRAKRELPIEISITFCSAHAVPKGRSADEATHTIITEQIPRLKQMIQLKEVDVENIDVFCETGVFSVEQSKKILAAGKDIGLRLNFHGDELHPTGSAEMGAELGATAISHLEEISDNGIVAMAKAGSVAVILPTTAFFLRLKPPPVRKMINSGVTIALGSDFNPNAYCYSMPTVMTLACINLGMSVTEALAASTLNAAAALGRASTHGSIEVGKYGDFILINADRWEHIIYQFGVHGHLIHMVIKNGIIVHKNVKS